MHDALEVVRKAVVVYHSRAVLVEVVLDALGDVLPDYPDVVVPVGAALVVEEPDAVEELVLHDAGVHTAACLQAQLLGRLALVANAGPAPAAVIGDEHTVSGRCLFKADAGAKLCLEPLQGVSHQDLFGGGEPVGELIAHGISGPQEVGADDGVPRGLAGLHPVQAALLQHPLLQGRQLVATQHHVTLKEAAVHRHLGRSYLRSQPLTSNAAFEREPLPRFTFKPSV